MIERPKPSTSLAQIPRGVWALGFVSLLMDISSEMIHALLPVMLGASMVTVGFIEGIAETTAPSPRYFPTPLRLARQAQIARGDRLRAGRVHQAGVFPLAPKVEWLLAARFIDRT